MDSNSSLDQNTNIPASQTDTSNDYYIALKRIEEEKEAKKKEKKKKKRLGCGVILLILILIPIINTISNSVQRAVVSSEPITDLDIREVVAYAKQNGVDNANYKFRTHKSGYNYRYKCIARYERVMDNSNVCVVSIPYWSGESNAASVNFVTTRLEVPEEYLPSERDYMLYEDVPDPLKNAWFLLDNVKINVYTSNSGALADPIIDSKSRVKIVYSQEEALEWLNSDG